LQRIISTVGSATSDGRYTPENGRHTPESDRLLRCHETTLWAINDQSAAQHLGRLNACFDRWRQAVVFDSVAQGRLMSSRPPELRDAPCSRPPVVWVFAV
jgi:hypothetical protein